LLSSSNNTIEDVQISGFTNGIVVGSGGAAQNNVLMNISGITHVSTVVNIPVHATASDLVIMGVQNYSSGSDTIYDGLTSTVLSDPSVAIYALGEANGNGYSRYTSSPNAATWVVGPNATPSGGCTAANLGSIFAPTVGSTGSLWVCENPTTGPTWTAVQ
jgi:hypothetical protein